MLANRLPLSQYRDTVAKTAALLSQKLCSVSKVGCTTCFSGNDVKASRYRYALEGARSVGGVIGSSPYSAPWLENSKIRHSDDATGGPASEDVSG